MDREDYLIHKANMEQIAEDSRPQKRYLRIQYAGVGQEVKLTLMEECHVRLYPGAEIYELNEENKVKFDE